MCWCSLWTCDIVIQRVSPHRWLTWSSFFSSSSSVSPVFSNQTKWCNIGWTFTCLPVELRSKQQGGVRNIHFTCFSFADCHSNILDGVWTTRWCQRCQYTCRASFRRKCECPQNKQDRFTYALALLSREYRWFVHARLLRRQGGSPSSVKTFQSFAWKKVNFLRKNEQSWFWLTFFSVLRDSKFKKRTCFVIRKMRRIFWDRKHSEGKTE